MGVRKVRVINHQKRGAGKFGSHMAGVEIEFETDLEGEDFEDELDAVAKECREFVGQELVRQNKQRLKEEPDPEPEQRSRSNDDGGGKSYSGGGGKGYGNRNGGGGGGGRYGGGGGFKGVPKTGGQLAKWAGDDDDKKAWIFKFQKKNELDKSWSNWPEEACVDCFDQFNDEG